MAKRKSPPPKPVPKTPVKPPQRATSSGGFGVLTPRARRETVESIAVAFILAFLFRGFVAEAYVIPTGSMAPTLMGAHKDLVCEKCGIRYQAGASSEAEDLAQQLGRQVMPQEVVAVTCPQCRYTMNVDPKTASGRNYPTYGGDRILVAKGSYELGEPQRWDVSVFKYPGEARTNYIKRIVGMPNETVRIRHGDLYFKPASGGEFEFDRRSPAKLRAMAQLVYDNDYQSEELTRRRWPPRWQNMSPAQGSQTGWTADESGRTFSLEPRPAGETRWLRYRHFTPSIYDWQALANGPLPDDYQPRPRLVTDFVAYNTSLTRFQDQEMERQPQLLGLHWVGDLMLECALEITGDEGAVVLDLVKGGRHFACELDCQTGEAKLSIDGLEGYAPKAQTSVRGQRRHTLALANIDRQLLLWVDGTPVTFDSATTYASLDNDRPRADDGQGDLAPAGIGVRKCGARASHLRLWRDIYYIAADQQPVADYPLMPYSELLRFWSTPELWTDGSLFDQRREVDFPLAEAQYFAMGDNSPMSQDARLWTDERYVARDLLVGKAFYIFWPHSFNRIPGTSIPFPFFPNFARMGLIR